MCSGLGNRRPAMEWAHLSPVVNLAFSLPCWLSKYEFAHQASVEGPTRVKGLVARPNAKGSIVHMLHVCIIQRWVGYTQFSQDKSKTRDVCLDEWTWIIQIVFLYRTMNSDLNMEATHKFGTHCRRTVMVNRIWPIALCHVPVLTTRVGFHIWREEKVPINCMNMDITNSIHLQGYRQWLNLETNLKLGTHGWRNLMVNRIWPTCVTCLF